jgi:hypothetical protein
MWSIRGERDSRDAFSTCYWATGHCQARHKPEFLAFYDCQGLVVRAGLGRVHLGWDRPGGPGRDHQAQVMLRITLCISGRLASLSSTTSSSRRASSDGLTCHRHRPAMHPRHPPPPPPRRAAFRPRRIATPRVACVPVRGIVAPAVGPGALGCCTSEIRGSAVRAWDKKWSVAEVIMVWREKGDGAVKG